jgi:hypothetical protein
VFSIYVALDEFESLAILGKEHRLKVSRERSAEEIYKLGKEKATGGCINT